MIIQEAINKYKKEVDYLDIELLLAHSLAQTREFVLMHPEYKLTSHQLSTFNRLIKRRIANEPIAHIVGHKEFYGLDFLVTKHTLIPRPETELMVEQVLALLRSELRSNENFVIADIGTGSGCIITSIAHTLAQDTSYKIQDTRYYATDISKKALKVARKNAKLNDVDKKIKFLHGSLLEPINKLLKDKKLKPNQLIITANLPYLSKEIYNWAADNVKKYEPKSALYSPEEGLQHYRLLLEQLKSLHAAGHISRITVFLEISPEQKTSLSKLIKLIFPKAKFEFSKDLAKKWRVCKICI